MIDCHILFATLLQLVLMLSSVADKKLEHFAKTEAIQCREIYEFVQKLGNKKFEMTCR